MPNNKSAKTIYVLDDDQPIVDVITQILQGAGHRVRGFTSVEAFESFLQTSMEQDFLMIVDHYLGRSNSIDLVARIRQMGVWQPYVVTSGVIDVNETVKIMRLGAVTVIPKPFDRSTLLSAVSLAEEEFAHASQLHALKARVSGLSAKEKEVLATLNAGHDIEKACDLLNITKKTLATHKTKIFAKLDVKSTSQLIALTKELYLGKD